MSKRTLAATALLLTATLAANPSAAHDPEADGKVEGWFDSAELSYVLTAGNSEASTLGFKNTLSRVWTDSLFTLKAGAVRADATTFSRTAVGTPESFTVIETDDNNLTAESYFLNGRYLHDITERFFWYGGLGWDRNRFAGIDSRFIAEAGVGNTWIQNDNTVFKTAYAATYTDQTDVLELPNTEGSFAGLRLSSDFLHKFGTSATYANALVLDENLDETDDWRADMVNSVAVSMSRRLALKASLQWLYDNQPSFLQVALVDSLGVPTGLTVPVELDELDTVFTTSLVINF